MYNIGYWRVRVDVKRSDVPSISSLLVVEKRTRTSGLWMSLALFGTLATRWVSGLKISPPITPHGIMYFPALHSSSFFVIFSPV